MIYILYLYVFSVGGDIPTEVETYKFDTMEQCQIERIKIADDAGAPTESECIEVPKNG